jgi:hypothetical protein
MRGMTVTTMAAASPAGSLAIVLDYSVLDHLQRIDAGTYRGGNEAALRRLRDGAVNRRVEVWISEITPVEMLHGLEKLAGDAPKRRTAGEKDAAKLAIAASMFARTLGYPCSKLDDTYSRIGMSFRCAGPDAGRANALEARLLQVPGVSPGDARQLVSCAFPFDGVAVEFHPRLDWFVAEDGPLIKALHAAMAAGSLPELAHLRCGSARDIVAAHPAGF